MKKLLAVLLLLCLMVLPAAAENIFAADAWLASAAAALVPDGVEAQYQTSEYVFSLPDGRQAVSVCLTAEGNLRFGRYDQRTHAALIDAVTGEELGLETVFANPDALQDFLDTYVEEKVLDSLNTYLDASEMLPVPLDCISFDAYGVTFHYSSNSFRYFSGHAGAVQLQWYELEKYLLFDPGAEDQLKDAYQGILMGVSLQEPLTALLEKYGTLADPDIVNGSQLIYELETPALRGLQLIGNPQAADAGVVLRASRFDLAGVRPGMSQADTTSIMGTPSAVRMLERQAALESRVKPGTIMEYRFDPAAGENPDANSQYCALLYYDETDSLYLLELRNGY